MIFFNTNQKYLRKRLAVNQEQLALAAKVRSTTISNWENKISSPDIYQFTDVCQFFGIPADVLLYVDLEKGNVITEAAVEDFKRKGKLNSNLFGNLIPGKSPIYPVDHAPSTMVNEADETMLFAVLNTLRQMDGKLDQVQDAVNKIKEISK